jgi:lysophospholipase L1-like esterase
MEWAARTLLGLGDPPLSVPHPTIEYLFKPGMYRRFGNIVTINSHHMRSREIPENKKPPSELRVLLFGDSVVNGGALTDQKDLASEILEQQLRNSLGGSVTVGNVSAGSWGPGNLLAYEKAFGFFDADIIVVVLNSGDIGDNPTGKPIVGFDPGFPSAAPAFAVGELLTRYVAVRVNRLLKSRAPAPSQSASLPEEAVARSIQDLAEFCEDARRAKAEVLLVHFPDRREIDGKMMPGHAIIRRFADEAEIPLIELTELIRATLAAGQNPYRENDPIHPNSIGQRMIATAIEAALRKASPSLTFP